LKKGDKVKAIITWETDLFGKMQAEKEITLEDTTPDPNQLANGMPAALMDVSMPDSEPDAGGAASFDANLKAVKQEFRSLRVALETYFIDKNQYPEKLDDLLKPVAYRHAIPADPFSPDQSPYHYRAEKEGGYTLWSVGPDQKDDDAQLKLDDASDAKSEGDLVFSEPGKKK
jgi:hypothetical protein